MEILKYRIFPLGALALVLLLAAVIASWMFRGQRTTIHPVVESRRLDRSVGQSEVTKQDLSVESRPFGTDGVLLSGKVVDSSGYPLSGATVLVRPEMPLGLRSKYRTSHLFQPKELIVSEDGLFQTSIVAGDFDVRIHATAPGYLPSDQKIHLTEGDVKDIECVLRRSASIEGTVLDINHRPIEFMLVEAQSIDTTHATHHNAPEVTSANGGYKISELEGGRYALGCRFLPPTTKKYWMGGIPVETGGVIGGAGPLKTVSLREGESLVGVELVVPWDSDRSLQGTVKEVSGRPVAGAAAWVEGLNSSQQPLGISATLTGADGKFRIMYIADAVGMRSSGTFAIRAQAKGYEPGLKEAVALGDKDITVVLKAATHGAISGRVVDATTDKPISTAKVELEGVNREWGDRWNNPDFLRPHHDASVSKLGEFKFEKVPTGTAALKVYAPNYGMNCISSIVVQAEATTEVEIPLMPAGKLEIDVRTAGLLEGRQFGDFAIECWPVGSIGDNSTVSNFYTHEALRGKPVSPKAEAPGKRTMGLPPGRYGVIVMARPMLNEDPLHPPGHSLTYREAIVESGQTTELTVVVGGSGTVSGFANPLENDSMTVMLVPGEGVIPSVQGGYSGLTQSARDFGAVYSASVLEDGSFIFFGVPEGVYTATLITRFGNTPQRQIVAAKTIDIAATAEITLQFP